MMRITELIVTRCNRKNGSGFWTVTARNPVSEWRDRCTSEARLLTLIDKCQGPVHLRSRVLGPGQ